MKIPKDILDPTFNENSIGWANESDLEICLKLNRGTLYIPEGGNLKWVAVLRRTRLELIPVPCPVSAWTEYKEYYDKTIPNINEKRLDFILEQRGQYYKDLGIHPLACIGEEGMGYEWHLDKWLEFPQRGGVEIGQDVRIGAYTVVKKGTIENTVIGYGCKIGSHCNIGHNVKIGDNCLLTHRVSIGGSTEVGDRVYFGQGSIIKNKIKIGDGAIIGQGANVLIDVPPNKMALGNPAKIYDKKRT